jgi:hypothetical protein
MHACMFVVAVTLQFDSCLRENLTKMETFDVECVEKTACMYVCVYVCIMKVYVRMCVCMYLCAHEYPKQ